MPHKTCMLANRVRQRQISYNIQITNTERKNSKVDALNRNDDAKEIKN